VPFHTLRQRTHLSNLCPSLLRHQIRLKSGASPSVVRVPRPATVPVRHHRRRIPGCLARQGASLLLLLWVTVGSKFAGYAHPTATLRDYLPIFVGRKSIIQRHVSQYPRVVAVDKAEGSVSEDVPCASECVGSRGAWGAEELRACDGVAGRLNLVVRFVRQIVYGHCFRRQQFSHGHELRCGRDRGCDREAGACDCAR
jgi:hypothetical protein